ncbi:MAG TPA: endolytic transglycosylase MltG [Anaeromyxobacteraceae bacterium]|nr:endolytic transglycosylase MltG [Anaeromyxobacteraceae bacterium]
MRIVRLLGLLVFLAVVAGGVFVWTNWRELRTFRDTPFGSGSEKIVEIDPGTSARGVIRRLAEAGALSDEETAWKYLRMWKRDKRSFKAGEYAFSGPLLPDDVLERIYKGEVKTWKFTVPEGLRADEIALIVEKASLGKATEILELVRDPEFAKELELPFPSLEGFLFPDTYAFPHSARPRDILSAMVARYREAWKRAEAGRRPGVELDEGQAVILASIIEKETGRADERPRISCVFHNRLAKGMRLETDPTVMYATMLRSGGRWSRNITKKDLRAPHPYNTYVVTGLPPGPIANPGEAALAAALAPSDCKDLYFVSRNDGSHVFCPDLRCHNAAVREWQVEWHRARRAAERHEASTAPAPVEASAPPRG